jgi:hypothetical protein
MTNLRFIKNFTILFLACSILAVTSPVDAAGAVNDPSYEPYAGEDVCLPGAYLTDTPGCLAYGPSIYISSLAQEGITYPLLPLTAFRPDAALFDLNYGIARVNVFPPERAPLFASLEDAVSGSNPVNYLRPSDLLYVAYSSQVDVNGGHYVLTASGGWMRASPASYSGFQGLVFNQPPQTSFGWIVEPTRAKVAPDYYAAELEPTLPPNSVVQIYALKQVDGLTYYMIGLNRWVERRYIRQLEYNPISPAGVDVDRWIEINLYEQTLSVYDHNQLVFATLIASGLDPYFTRPGLFQIQEKKDSETMSGGFEADLSDYYYLEDVPWTMYYDQDRAIHGAYWRAMLGYPQSHGCVNMSVSDAHWVYDWAKVGDWVYVWDPSGQTPTDPSLYTPGGA